MHSEIMRYIDRALANLARRMRNIVARGVVTMVQDDPKMQENQIELLNDELIERVEHPQPYGFTSHPHVGAECFVVFNGADRGHGIVLVVDDRRYRIKGSKPGEVVIYTDEGDQIALKRGNNIEVTTKHFTVNATDSVVFKTSSFTVEAEQTTFKTNALGFSNRSGEAVEAKFQGSINASDDIKARSISLIHHTHSGVESGADVTGTPVGSK